MGEIDAMLYDPSLVLDLRSKFPSDHVRAMGAEYRQVVIGSIDGMHDSAEGSGIRKEYRPRAGRCSKLHDRMRSLEANDRIKDYLLRRPELPEGSTQSDLRGDRLDTRPNVGGVALRNEIGIRHGYPDSSKSPHLIHTPRRAEVAKRSPR